MKKGFTLVELLATIVIIAILGLLVVPKLINIVSDNKEDLYKEMELTIQMASLSYMTENYYGTDTTEVRISVTDLVNAGMMDEIIDLTDNSTCDGYAIVTGINMVPNAKGYIKCTNYTTEGYVEE